MSINRPSFSCPHRLGFNCRQCYPKRDAATETARADAVRKSMQVQHVESPFRSYTKLTRTAMVRCSHSQESVWRESLGGSVPLHVFVTEGSLDAPEWMPSGSMQSGPKESGQGPVGRVVQGVFYRSTDL